MGEHPSPTEAPEPRPATPANDRPAFPFLWTGGLLLAAAVAATLLVCWGTWRTGPLPPNEAPEPAARKPAAVKQLPPQSPAELLGLSPEVPRTVESLNQEAFETCARLIRDLPDRPEAYAVAAFIYNRHGRTAEATGCWEKALRINPSFAPSYCGLGIIAATKGDYDKAVEVLRRAIELDPSLEQAYSLLVDALLRKGQPEAALAAARQYVARFPESADSHYWLGQAHQDLGQYEEARKSHEAAVRIDPMYTAAYFALAAACARLGQQEPARQYREKFAELKQKDQEQDRGRAREYRDFPEQQKLAASYHLAAGNVHLAFGDPKKAEAHWLRGAAVAPALAACREALVAYYERQDRPAEALGQLKELVAINPNNAAYWTRSGRLEAVLGEWDAAEASFRKAIQLAPDAAEGYSGLVRLHLQFGRPLADAPALAEKAAALAPSAQAYLALAEARDQSGDRQGAIAAAKKAQELEPNSRQVRGVYEQLTGNKP